MIGLPGGAVRIQCSRTTPGRFGYNVVELPPIAFCFRRLLTGIVQFIKDWLASLVRLTTVEKAKMEDIGLLAISYDLLRFMSGPVIPLSPVTPFRPTPHLWSKSLKFSCKLWKPKNVPFDTHLVTVSYTHLTLPTKA